ncbi:FUSC family protein [Mycobacterium hackensackense]|uniref:FUSC family protein n=1 Tax=Mycobacterium hackensackense TaxID=228909 RepID=UPI00226590CE|nr:FUSC family protein [Mycobacterium hackensackense]MCV7251073.1 FUSC family protein [Mycobacterium hackensackense]
MPADASFAAGPGFGALFRMRPSPPRWPMGVRAAVSAAVPILIGWATGDLGAGLIATLGAFTCRFGGDRPYLNRGTQLAVIAVTLAAAVTLGAWVAPIPWLAVTVVSVIAATAVWLCAALSVGPPGAYIFVIVCAAGVGVSASQLPPWQIGLLVLAGGALAWTTQMAGAFLDFRGPEKAAVAAAGDAVAACAEHPEDPAVRDRAASALYRAWNVLVSYQPLAARPGGTLDRLRDANHALHVLFSTTLRAADAARPVPPECAATVRAVARLDLDPAGIAVRDRDRRALRPPRIPELLRQALAPGAHTRRVMLRVAVAAPLAGATAAITGVGHVYWAVAAAVLVLHTGIDRTATLRRGTERLVGTWIGLVLAAAVLVVHPQGPWLALVVAALQFVIEILVTRNYTLASVFITAAALTASTAAHRVDVGPIIVDRGLDTLIGCAVGIAVYLFTAPRQEAGRLGAAVADTLVEVAAVARYLCADTPATLAARAARRDLQRAVLDLGAAYGAALGGTAGQTALAQQLTATVSAAESLGYLMVTSCWAAEDGATTLLAEVDGDKYVAALGELARKARTGAPIAEELALLTPTVSAGPGHPDAPLTE